MNYEELIRKNQEIIEIGDRVIYVPTHAEGNLNHLDCEYGTVSSWNDKFIFVKYVRNGIPQMTAQATDPRDLYLDGKGPGMQNVLEIFEALNNGGS
jgi:hypothetical protein